jgi:hypothetical protein
MQDRKVVLAIVGTLGAAALVALVGMVLLAWTGKPQPDGLVPIATGALGALAALLASTRTTSEQPQPVQVANEPGDPVPVAEQPRQPKAAK